jgi:hypothetical protein
MHMTQLSRSARRLEVERLESRWVPGAIRNLPGFTANNLGAVDDASSAAITLPFTLNFEGTTTSTIFVNSNGNITLNAADPNDKDSATFPLNSVNAPMLMPFWADVDTSGGTGSIFFGTDTLFGHQAFAATWVNVPAFFHGSVLNSFQVILVDRSETGAGNFDIEYNYDQIHWDTGDASAVSATMGYSNGTNNSGTFFALPGSGGPANSGAFLDGGPEALISHSLLSNVLGRYHFLVRGGQVVQPTRRVFYPFRYITDPNTGIMRGNLTIINSIGGISSSGIDADLGIALSGPVTVVLPNLPTNLHLVNATGTAASGSPFITLPISAVPLGIPVRVQLQFDNPLFNAPSTFFGGGFSVEVFLGPFSPSMA